MFPLAAIVAAAAASPTPPPNSSGAGLTWSTLVLAIVLAMFAGGFLGNLMASNRLRAPTVSVYSVIEERIREGREA